MPYESPAAAPPDTHVPSSTVQEIIHVEYEVLRVKVVQKQGEGRGSCGGEAGTAGATGGSPGGRGGTGGDDGGEGSDGGWTGGGAVGDGGGGGDGKCPLSFPAPISPSISHETRWPSEAVCTSSSTHWQSGGAGGRAGGGGDGDGDGGGGSRGSVSG